SQPGGYVIQQEMVVKSYDIKTSSSKKQYGLLSVQSKASNQAVHVLIRDESLMKSLQHVSAGEILNLELYEENSFYFLKNYAERRSEERRVGKESRTLMLLEYEKVVEEYRMMNRMLHDR